MRKTAPPTYSRMDTPMATDPSPPQASPSALEIAKRIRRRLHAGGGTATLTEMIAEEIEADRARRTPPPPALPDVRETAFRIVNTAHGTTGKQRAYLAEKITAALQAQASESHAEGARAMREAAAMAAIEEAEATADGDGEMYIARKIADRLRALPLPGQGETTP